MKFIITIFAINLLFGLNTSLSDSSDLTTNETRLYADVVIDSLEIMNKNIRILGGELNVYGTVESQITVIGGDVHIFPTGVINGRLLSLAARCKRKMVHRLMGKLLKQVWDKDSSIEKLFLTQLKQEKRILIFQLSQSDIVMVGFTHTLIFFHIIEMKDCGLSR